MNRRDRSGSPRAKRASRSSSPTSDRELSALEAHLGYWLRAVSNHVSYTFQAKVERHGVTVAEWVLMRALWDVESLRPSELADTLGLTRGAVSKLVVRLAAKRLISCRNDPQDRRSQHIALTTDGRQMVPTLVALADDNDTEMFAFLGKERLAELSLVLREFATYHRLKGAPIA